MNLFSIFGGEGGEAPLLTPKKEIDIKESNEEEFKPLVPEAPKEPDLSDEAAKRNISNVTSWQQIHEFDMEYFEEELRKIYGLEPGQDVKEEAIRRAEDGVAFTLDIIAKYYGLPPGSSFEEILKKKNSQK